MRTPKRLLDIEPSLPRSTCNKRQSLKSNIRYEPRERDHLAHTLIRRSTTRTVLLYTATIRQRVPLDTT